jgi:hypothetical protein
MCLLRIGVNEGDEIAIVSGARTPFDLRRTSAANKYTLESDAYLWGRMCGEALQEESFNPTKINRV